MAYLLTFSWMLCTSVGFTLLNRTIMENSIHRFTIRIIENVIIFFPAFWVAAWRTYVGTDYTTYMQKQIPEVLNGWSGGVEPLYRLLIKLGYSLGNYQYIFVLTHLLIILCVVVGLANWDYPIVLAVIAFWGTGYYNYSMNIMRQAIGMAVFLVAFKYLDKSNVKYVVFILIASLFHKSALMYLLLIPIKNIKISYKTAAISLISIYAAKPLIRVILFFVTSKIGFYSWYFGTSLDTGQQGNVFLVANVLILGAFYLVNGSGSMYKKAILLQFLTTLVAVLSSIVPNYERVMYLFMVAQIITLPYIAIIAKKYERAIVIGFVLIAYLLIFVKLFAIGNIGQTFPYHSYWW